MMLANASTLLPSRAQSAIIKSPDSISSFNFPNIKAFSTHAKTVRITRNKFRGVRASVAGIEHENKQESHGKDDEVKAVLFDMDGVLCNSEDRSRLAAVALFEEYGVNVSAEDFIPFMGTGEANFLGGVAKLYNVADFDPTKAKNRFFEIYIDNYAQPNSGLGYDGALELVLQCKSAGLKCAVASSADRVKVNANLSASGLPQENFNAIVSADKFERLKPSPDIFLAAAKELGVPAKQCIVIEDALAGVQAAAAAGMRCIAVTTTLSEAELKSKAKPSLVRQNIAYIKLKDIVECKYPDLSTPGENPLPAAPEAEETTVGAPEWSLDSPLSLPGGIETTRRDLIRATSLGIGLGTTAFTVTHLKALSYASPKALWNSIFGNSMPASDTSEMASQVTLYKKYIRELDQRSGGTFVPEFETGLDWLNSPPLKFSQDLKGKIVVLDFWTYCCINCMHVLPDLAFLEKKYADQPVLPHALHECIYNDGGTGKAGFKDGAALQSQLSEPAGLAVGPNGSMFVADTNNSVIRLLTPTASGSAWTLSTLDLSSVPSPASPGPKRLRRRQTSQAEVVQQETPIAAGSGNISVRIAIPRDYHFTKGAASRFEVECEPAGSIQVDPVDGSFDLKEVVAEKTFRFSTLPDFQCSGFLRVNCKVFYCQQDEVCLYKELAFVVPLFAESGSSEIQTLNLAYEIAPRAVSKTLIAA